ncbi:unnamed protein product [Notodromas monacha]|uniref:F-box/SPRY domain-containing protein 1 n=1 Tax=Notodromas monacha TaxID=399045 RepID=A0A7R9BTN9_9CRUS|nr:unnamed protein product [Notodromas monacha]CAG0920520.1 unnamed protein product [Notodromas monacha]
MAPSFTRIHDLPDSVLELIFSFLELSALPNCALVCRRWNHVLNDEDGDVWRTWCLTAIPEDSGLDHLLSVCPTFKAKLRAFHHAWNPHDCSRNIYVKSTAFTLHRNPVAQSTDATRAKIGFRTGRHAWEVVWEGPLGTVAVVGIATKDLNLQCHGYVPLLGSDDNGWGWNLVDNHLLHGGDSQGNYPQLNNPPKYQVGDRIRVILDCEDSTLSFEKDYEFLGVAFRDGELEELKYEVYDAIKTIRDPEKPQDLEELGVVSEDGVTVARCKYSKDVLVTVTLVPTVPHCSLATLIGLCVRVRLEQALSRKAKVDIFITFNKQLNDKERVAAAMENPNLKEMVFGCLDFRQ